jgi:glutamate synthase domain-containing protein 2/glutamate synthase domain-containing protein 3/NADPH-dependent glutamate synthase beta subunit-like oxidoreductase/glutamate synthase domain-containing protein 1
MKITSTSINSKPSTTPPIKQKTEFGSCAVGLVSGSGGIKLVNQFLQKLPHRGGRIFKNYEGEIIRVGDGAGVSCDINWDYYGNKMAELGIEKPADKPCAIGNFFLPIDETARLRAIDIIAQICSDNNVQILTDEAHNPWRKIPFASDDSQAARELKLQNFEQCFLTPTGNTTAEEFQKILLKIHREIEQKAYELDQEYLKEEKKAPKLAVASLSSERIVYKGMILPEEVEHFTDLLESDPDNIVYHIRQSTNTSPSPGNAQTFEIIAHNGELNSVDGNADKNHRPSRGFSDSRTFDEHLRFLIEGGMDIVEALTTLMPPPNNGDPEIDAMLEDMRSKGLEYNGPAHMVFVHNGIQGSKLDSSALRPSRYLIAQDASGNKQLFTGSEDMMSAATLKKMGLKAVERGMLQAGEMIVIDRDGVVKKNDEILKDLQKRYQPTNQQIDEIAAIKRTIPEQTLDISNIALERQRFQINSILGGDTKKIGMGDDTNPLKTDPESTPTDADHLKQKFAQVSAPSLDRKKERDSFSLTILLGDRDIKEDQRHLYKVKSPILKLGELEAIEQQAAEKTFKIDLTFDLSTLPPEAQTNEEQKDLVFFLLRQRINQICQEVEREVRAGKSVIILDGSKISQNNMGLPDVLVTAAVYSHLHKQGLDKKASIIVNSAQADSAHHCSALCAVGAAAVSPAFYYELASINSVGHIKAKLNREKAYQEGCKLSQKALEDGHLDTMAKFGITSADVYRGSGFLESLTLNLEERSDQDISCVGEAFRMVKYCSDFVGKFGVDDLLRDRIADHQKKYTDKIITSGHFAYSPHGVNHTFNPTVIDAIRDATTDYRTKRKVVAHFSALAKNLEIAAESISQINGFDLDNYKENLKKQRLQFSSDIQTIERAIVQRENQNDKLYNSLLFIDDVVKDLTSIIDSDDYKEALAESRKDGGSLRYATLVTRLTRQLISIVGDSQTENFVSLCINYSDGKLSAEELKTALFAKAGYDAKEIKKVEEWAQLFKDEKPAEAAKLFVTLNPQNQERIKAVFQERDRNKQEIAGFKSKLLEIGSEETICNILLDIANHNPNASQKSYLEAIGQRCEKLRDKAKEHNLLPTIIDGKFSTDEMDVREIDEPFARAMADIAKNKKDFRVTIADHLDIVYPENVMEIDNVQSVSDIVANHFVTGGMSYGALTLSAHQDISKAAQLIGGMACTGEGGKPEGQKAKMVQIASGRFGLTPEYFDDAEVIEIKIVQGAKPGEGGMLPAGKVSVEIAAKRGSTVGVGLISPPPHHDIYSIEDLQELIHDLKEAKPKVKVAVKLCAAEGIDQIAIGVAKSGADIINIAGGSGGTGAASVDSIKNAGLPSEVGLVMVHQALAKAGIRNLVKLQVSGFPNTPEGVVIMAILGGDILESGTTDLMLLGCDMHRQCNVPGACAPGITNNESGYQGHAEDLALYKLNMGKAVQDLLKKLGVSSLKELHGRVDLLPDPKSPDHPLKGKVSDEFIESLCASSDYEQLPEEKLEEYRTKANLGSNLVEYKRLFDAGFLDKISGSEAFSFDVGEIDVVNRTFGATLAFANSKQLVNKVEDFCTLKTSGVAGQSYGAFNVHGFCLEHTGSVQDGFGKSMSGGVLVVKQPEEELDLTDSIYVGNATLYGASGGKAFIAGAGSRCGVLMKGATLVVNGNVGDYACEYMTSGTFVALGKVGRSFGSGMSGGIAALYNKDGYLEQYKMSDDVRKADVESGEHLAYLDALYLLLKEDAERTCDLKAQSIVENWEIEKNNFQIVIPRSLDQIKTLEDLDKQQKSFELRYNFIKHGEDSVSIFEKAWLTTKRAQLIQGQDQNKSQSMELDDDGLLAMHNRAIPDLVDHAVKMRRYGLKGTKIVSSLGVPEQNLSDDLEELLEELFDEGKKCSGCDSASCGAKKTKLPEQSDIGCPIHKEPNAINAILKTYVPTDYELQKVNGDRRLARARKAFEKQIEQSPFAGFTGLACPAPCQDACTQTVDDESVKIKRIELLLHRIAAKEGWYEKVFAKPLKTRPEKVMIIGSGPAALEAAYHLAKQGIQVDIFEKNNVAGGLLRYGIPDHKLQKQTIDFYVDQLKEMGVKFHLNEKIDIETFKEQDKYKGYDLYLDGRGIVETPHIFHKDFPKTNIDEGGNHSMAMDFLTYCNIYFYKKQSGKLQAEDQHPFDKFKLGKRVVVLGSADTAKDVKLSILKLNNELPEHERRILVTISRQPVEGENAKHGAYYPKPGERGRDPDLHQVLHNEDNLPYVEYYDNLSPNEFVLENGRITGLTCEEVYSENPDFSRGFRETAKTGETKNIECDSVITAIGFKAEKTTKTFEDIKTKGAVIQIGDQATKSGFIKDGSELIVSAEASGKKVANYFIEHLLTRDRDLLAASYKTSFDALVQGLNPVPSKSPEIRREKRDRDSSDGEFSDDEHQPTAFTRINSPRSSESVSQLKTGQLEQGRLPE